MKRTSYFAVPAALSLLLSAAPALAHEHHTFRIGDHEYGFTVGSLNEPVYVDDKTGVDLRIERMGGEKQESHGHAAAADAHDEGTPVTGLEKTLKVELIAGDRKRVLDLAPAYGAPGSYKAPFYPTVATTLTYRVFGELEGTPVDLSFTCNPAGHPATPEDTTEVSMGEGVTRIHKAGAFGCPRPKSDAGFPEPAASLRDLAAPKPAAEQPSSPLPLALGALGTVLGAAALVMKKK